jgi:hypothetical protein
LLTEAEVRRSYQIIIKKASTDPTLYDKAEALLDELRPESPLRLRLMGEITELRRMSAAKS